MSRSDSSSDALKGIGHACGHNLIAVSSVAAALATARLMQEESLDGKVVLFGTPAEGRSGSSYFPSIDSSIDKELGRSCTKCLSGTQLTGCKRKALLQC